ncbi:MAG: DUF1707 SHOCT-like domain-containing protein [Solirubrobacteraceae bacterium]
MSEPPELRVSDADREATIARLRWASGEGRLSFEELAEWVERAEAALTASELEPLTADLPEGGPAAAPVAATARKPVRWTVALMGGADRRGRWRPAPRTKVVAVMGGADIDLREARIEGSVVEVVAVAVMGGIDVIVPEDVEVELGGFALMGANESPRDPGPTHDGAPLVRIRAFSLMGGVSAKRRKPKRPA